MYCIFCNYIYANDAALRRPPHPQIHLQVLHFTLYKEKTKQIAKFHSRHTK